MARIISLLFAVLFAVNASAQPVTARPLNAARDSVLSDTQGGAAIDVCLVASLTTTTVTLNTCNNGVAGEVGDYLSFEDSPVVKAYRITAVAGSTYTIASAFTVSPAVSSSVSILRWHPLRLDESGVAQVGVPGTVLTDVVKWGGTSTTIGQKVMASSVPVTIASNQSYIPTRNTEYGPAGLVNYYWNIAGFVEIPTTVIGDPITGTPWSITGGFGMIQGAHAHASTDADNPVKTGHRARTSNITAVTNNQTSDQIGDVLGFSGVTLAHNNRSDTFTTTANGTTLGDGFQTWKHFSIQVDQTGVVTLWDVRLEGSLDGTTFTQILQHTNATGTGVTVWQAAGLAQPVLYIRARCAGLTLGAGTNVIAKILATQ